MLEVQNEAQDEHRREMTRVKQHIENCVKVEKLKLQLIMDEEFDKFVNDHESRIVSNSAVSLSRKIIILIFIVLNQQFNFIPI